MADYENYSYLDQLQDTTLDFEDYLVEFSSASYDIEFNNDQPVVVTIKNLFQRYKLVEDYLETMGGKFTIYNIKEGELPDDVARTFYDSEDFWWAILLFNDIKNPLTDWPMTEEQINYLVRIYTSIENKYSEDGYYQLIFNKNEDMRKIKILSKANLDKFIGVLSSISLQESLTLTDKFYTVQI